MTWQCSGAGFCCGFTFPTSSGRRGGMTRRRQAIWASQDRPFKGQQLTAEVRWPPEMSSHPLEDDPRPALDLCNRTGFEVLEAEHAEAAPDCFRQPRPPHPRIVYRHPNARNNRRFGACASYLEALAMDWVAYYLGSAPPGSRSISRGKPIFGEAIPTPSCHSSYSRASRGRLMPLKVPALAPVRTWYFRA